MFDLIRTLFSSAPFIPHGHCFLWNPTLVWLHVGSDAVIALAYYSIPLTLFNFVQKRRDLPFNWIFILFAAFITACGTSHLMTILTLWHPTYWLSGTIKAITAAVSLGTAIVLVALVPKALAIPSAEQLERANWALQQEIAERERTQTQLELQAVITKNIAEGICLVRVDDGIIVYANPKFEQMFGYEPNELHGKPVSIVNYEDEQTSAEAVTQAIKHEVLQQNEAVYEVHNIKKDGTPFWCEAVTSAFKHPEYGTVLVAVQQDITQRKQAEAHSSRLAAIVESSSDAILSKTLDGLILSWNAGAEALFGYSAAEAIGKSISMLVPPERIGDLVQHGQKIGQQNVAHFETERIRKDGQRLYVSITVSPIKDNAGNVTAISAIYRDITERKRTEEQLQVSLKEKEVLLKEIHHRVKNNLQIVYSLLNLQRRRLKDQLAANALLESQSRIESIALIHEKLYQSEDLAHISLAEYIPSLVANLFGAYKVNHGQISLITEIEPIFLDIDQAIRCGLIINELLSNALKYAFVATAQTNPHIYIRLFTRLKESTITLIIGDNGVGIASYVDFSQTETLGLQLVQGFVGQLKGTLQVCSNGGTEFQIVFPGGVR